MKLILDANISWRLIKKLINFPDSIHINQSKLPQPASDIDIWNFAKKNNYIILTFDEDFYHLSMKYGYPPKVILLNSENQTSNFVLKLLNHHQNRILQFESSLDEGVLHILE
jgi:predicted nuclease of predicted toxin-antitoxin system